MKCKNTLTAEQCEMVQQHLRLIHWVIREYIDVNERICGLTYDDLFQEGAMALCHAASTYRPGSTQFKTYAVTLIRNHLIDHCRRISAQLKNTPTISLDAPKYEDQPPPLQALASPDDETEAWISRLSVAQVLEHGKRTYSGVAKLGIEALELKIKGFSGTDIAALYQTRPNHVGAWISRAAEKLRSDAFVIELLGNGVEKSTPNP